MKVNFSIITQSGGRWSKDRWYVPPWYQASRLFLSLFWLASIPKFIALSKVAILGQAIHLHFTKQEEGKKKDKGALSPFKNTVWKLHTQFSFMMSLVST